VVSPAGIAQAEDMSNLMHQHGTQDRRPLCTDRRRVHDLWPRRGFKAPEEIDAIELDIRL
jgi:hypothetical protein